MVDGWRSHCAVIHTCINTKKGEETTKNRERRRVRDRNQGRRTNHKQEMGLSQILPHCDPVHPPMKG